MGEPPVASATPADGWASGGDGVCATLIDYEPVDSLAAPGTAHSYPCGRPSSLPILIDGVPHVVCTVCGPELIERGTAQPMPPDVAGLLTGAPPDSINLLP